MRGHELPISGWPNEDGSYADATEAMIDAGVAEVSGRWLGITAGYEDSLREAVRAAYRRMVIMDTHMAPADYTHEER